MLGTGRSIVCVCVCVFVCLKRKTIKKSFGIKLNRLTAKTMQLTAASGSGFGSKWWRIYRDQH